MKSFGRIAVEKGCCSYLASAVDLLNSRFQSCSTKHRLNSLLRVVVQPAWQSFSQDLPADQRIWAKPEMQLHKIARSRGLRYLEDLVVSRYRAFRALEVWSSASLEASFETLINIIIEFRMRRPQKLSNGRTNRLSHQFCLFCGEETEYGAYGGMRNEEHVAYEPEGRAGILSVKYCSKHRPTIRGEKSNRQYQWARDHFEEFKTELSRLERRSVSMRRNIVLSELDDDLNAFYFYLLGPDAIYTDEEPLLRNEARRIVDDGICDRLKRLVMMRVSGHSFEFIAKKLNWNSRQAASKALASVPPRYRFDMDVSKGIASSGIHARRVRAATRGSGIGNRSSLDLEFLNALPVNLISALTNSDVAEIMLNPDGILWVDYHYRGMAKVGEISRSDAMGIIRLVARMVGIEPAGLIEL